MKRKLFTILTLAIASWSGTVAARSVARPLQLPAAPDAQQKATAAAGLAAAGSDGAFTENIGQVKDQYGKRRQDIDFKVRGNGVSVFLGDAAIRYQWITDDKQAANKAVAQLATVAGTPLQKMMYRMDVELVGADKNALVLKEDRQAYFEQYLNKGLNGQAFTFKKVTYKNVYPSIDWVFYFNASGKLEHDFIVHPGGNVADIKMKYGGATGLNINKDGSLTATTPMGSVTESAPHSYTEDGRTVASAFSLKGNMLTFRTAPSKGKLTIDPTLAWGTYYGTDAGTSGSGMEMLAIRPDSDGNIYVAGTAGDGYSNVVTTGSYQSVLHVEYYMTWAIGVNQFLLKMNSQGQRQWATYYGNDVYVIGTGLACDTKGNVYLAGGTMADTAIATTGAHQAAYGGGTERDAYLVKFSGTGQRLWGTYYGGSGEDIAYALACDTSDNIYMVGRTRSNTNIASAGSHKTTLVGTEVFFAAKFNSSGVRQWGTYYGENASPQYGWLPYMSASVDLAGNLYFAANVGVYPSTVNLPADMTTAGSHQPAYAGKNDVLLVKLNKDGVRQWGTYYGGAKEDLVVREALAHDKWGNVYLFGRTHSASGIASAGAHQTTLAGGGSSFVDSAHYGGDGFLAKFNPAGVRQWATYYGGAGSENGYGYGGVTCDAAGNIVIAGTTESNTGIATAGNYQSFILSESSGYIAKFDTAGVRKWGTYFGNISEGRIEGLCTNNSGNIYITGTFNDYYNLSTTGAHQTTPTMLYIGKFDDCADLLAKPDTILGSIALCKGATKTYSVAPVAGATSYTWILPSGWTGNSTLATIDVTAGSNNGKIGVLVNSSCGKSDTTFLDVTVNALPVPVITVTGNVLSTGTFDTYQWQLNGIDIPGATANSYTATANGNYTVVVTNDKGCKGTSAIKSHNITAIKDPALLSQIRIFPSPATAYLNINSPVALYVTLCSIEGRVLSTSQVTAGTHTIDIKALTPGIYLVRIADKNQQLLKTEKLVKQ